jgi:hypothetical protein
VGVAEQQQHRIGMAPVVLCVAEKPSLAASLAGFLSDGKHETRRAGLDVHEFTRSFRGIKDAHFKARGSMQYNMFSA